MIRLRDKEATKYQNYNASHNTKYMRRIRSTLANVDPALVDIYCIETKVSYNSGAPSISLLTSLKGNAPQMRRHADGVKATTAEMLISEGKFYLVCPNTSPARPKAFWDRRFLADDGIGDPNGVY